MPAVNFDYNTFNNFGFNVNPDYTGFADKTPNQALNTALYYYANSAQNSNYAEKVREIFGPGVMPIDSPDTNYFVGRAVLAHYGYLDSPYQYYIQNNIPVPQGLEVDADAYELIGKQVMQQLQDNYQRNQHLDQELKRMNENLPQVMASAITTWDDASLESVVSPELYSVLAENGFDEDYYAALQRGRRAWEQIRILNLKSAQDFAGLTGNTPALEYIAEELSNDEGETDELALAAFLAALNKHARDVRPNESPFWSNTLAGIENFWKAREATPSNADLLNTASSVYAEAISEGKSEREALSESIQRASASGPLDPRVRLLRDHVRTAMNTNMEASEHASWWARNISAPLGKALGQSAIPMAGAIAATATTGGSGLIARAAAGWFGGYASSERSLINQATDSAYAQGVNNPEAYGRLQGIADAASEGLFNAGGSLLASWKLVGGGLNRAAARGIIRSRLINSPAGRTILTYFGASAIEGTGEVMEEELAELLGAGLINTNRMMGVEMSPKTYTPGEALRNMPAIDIQGMYLLAFASGGLATPFNYRTARQLVRDREYLRRYLPQEKIDELTEIDIAHNANNININARFFADEESRERAITDEQTAYLKAINEVWVENVLNKPEEVKKLIEADNVRILEEDYVRTLLDSYAAKAALRTAGFTNATPNSKGNYDMTFYVKGENGETKLETREWTEQQLINFLRFQGGTKLHNDIMQFQSVIAANEYAKEASLKDIEAAIVSIRDTKAATILMEHGGVMTEDFFRALAEEVAQDSSVFPLSATQLNALATGIASRKETAMATDEGKALGITKDTKVVAEAFNVSNNDGSHIIGYVSGQTGIRAMLEELFEIDLKNRVKNGTTTWNQLGEAIAQIEKRMPGVTLLERKEDGSFTANAVIEAYSNLAQANLLANLATYTNLPSIEQAILTDTLSVMRKGKLIQTLAGAWKTYTAENAANADANISKLMDIMKEAGFTFGTRFQGILTAAEHRMQVMEDLGFEDFEQQAQEIAEGAAAQDEATIASVQEKANITQEEQDTKQAQAGFSPEDGTLATDGQPTATDEKTGREGIANPNGSVTITINPNQIFVADVLKDTPIIKANFDASGQEIVAIRDDAGKLHAVSGISQLQNAKEQGVNFTKVTIFDNFKAWSNDNIIAYNAYQNIISGQGLTQDYANYFRYSGPLSNAEVMEQGLGTPNEDGDMPASLEAGRAIAEQATEEDMQQLNKGELSKKKVKELVQKAEEAKVPQDLLNLRKKIAKGKATSKDFTEFFVNNPITHAAAIEMGIVPLTEEGQPTEAYKEGRKEAEYILAAKAEADAAAAAEAAAQAQKQLPAQAKWPAPSPKAKPLSEQETKKTLVTIAGKSAEQGNTRYVLQGVILQRKNGTEYIVATDGKRMSIISQPTYKSDTDNSSHEYYSLEGNPKKIDGTYPDWKQVVPTSPSEEIEVDLSYYSFITKGSLRGKGKGGKYINSQYFDNGQDIALETNTGYVTFSPVLFRDIYKQMQELGKAFGFPPIIKIRVPRGSKENGWEPIKLTAEHNGIRYEHVLMPRYRAKEDIGKALPGDIILGEQPTIYSEEMQDANFSIAPVDELKNRFEGNTLAERMARFIKRESKRLSKTLRLSGTTGAAVEAVASTQAILNSLYKYVENGTFKLSREDISQMTALRNIVNRYARAIKNGTIKTFSENEKKTLQREMQKVIEELSRSANGVISTEEQKQILADSREEALDYLYKKHAQILINKLSNAPYQASSEVRTAISAYERAVETGYLNKGIPQAEREQIEDEVKKLANTYTDSSGNVHATEVTHEQRMQLIRKLSSAKLAQIRKEEQARAKEYEKGKAETIEALTVILKHSRVYSSTTLGEPELRQLHEAVNAEAEEKIAEIVEEKENALLSERNNEETEAAKKKAYSELVTKISKGSIEQTLSSMLDEAGNILERYLKAELQQRIDKLIKSIEVTRKGSKVLKGKLHASSYRRIDAIVKLMGMSQAAKDDALDSIYHAKKALERNEMPAKGTFFMLDEVRENLGEEATAEDIIEALSRKETDILVFGCIEGMSYQQALEAYNAFMLVLRMRRTAWEAKQHAKRMRIVRLLRDFFAATENKNLGEVQAHLDIAPNEAKLADLSPDSLMNPYQLMLALSSFEGLKPIFEPLMYDLARARIAREVHLRQKLREEREAIARILNIQPKNGVSYTEEDLKEVINKFDDLFVTWNKVENTGITTTRQENLGYSTQEEAELEGKTLPKEERGRATQTSTAKLELTRWEAAHLVLMYRQKDYKKNAEANGITEDVLSKLEDFCGSKLLAVMDYLQKAIANDGTVQEVEARTGAPMRENEKYFPARANIKALDPKGTKVEGISLLQVNPFEWMRERVSHTEQLEPYNAYTVYRTALASRANYVFFEPITETLEKLLSNKAFANRLYSLIGENLYRQLILTIGEIKNASWQETVMQDIGTTKLQRFFDTSVALLLSGNPSSYVRQITAANNAGLMPGINPVTAIKYLKLIKKGKAKASCSEIAELNAIKTRYRDNAFVNELIRLGRNASFSRMFNLARAGLNVMEKIDIFSNTIAATIVYNQKYDQLTKEGNLTEEEILKRCEQEVELYVALLAQPLSRLDKSAAYWIISQHAIGRSLMYMGSENINKAGHLRALYIMNKNQPSPYLEKHPKLKKWVEGSKLNSAIYSLLATAGVSIATIGIARFAVELFIAAMTGDTPDEDDSYLAWLTAMFAYANLSTVVDSMPALSSFISPFVSMYTHRNGKLNIPGVGIFNTAPKIWEMCTDDKDYSPAEWEIATTRFLRDFTAWSALLGGYYSGIPYVAPVASTLASATAATNLLYPFARGARNEAWWTTLLPEPLTEWLTESDTRKPSRRKMWLERKLTPSED